MSKKNGSLNLFQKIDYHDLLIIVIKFYGHHIVE